MVFLHRLKVTFTACFYISTSVINDNRSEQKFKYIFSHSYIWNSLELFVCTRNKLDITAVKTRQTDDSNANGTRRDIKVKRQMLGTLTSFFSVGLHKVKPVWRNNNISLGSKVKLMRSIAISVFLSIFLYACELWTFAAEVEKRMQAFKM